MWLTSCVSYNGNDSARVMGQKFENAREAAKDMMDKGGDGASMSASGNSSYAFPINVIIMSFRKHQTMLPKYLERK